MSHDDFKNWIKFTIFHSSIIPYIDYKIYIITRKSETRVLKILLRNRYAFKLFLYLLSITHKFSTRQQSFYFQKQHLLIYYQRQLWTCHEFSCCQSLSRGGTPISNISIIFATSEFRISNNHPILKTSIEQLATVLQSQIRNCWNQHERDAGLNSVPDTWRHLRFP